MLNFPRNKSIKSCMTSGMPNVADTLNGWEIPITLIVITQDVIDGDLSPTATEVNFMGVWQPFSMQELSLLPEGQRNWSHFWLHTKNCEVNLNNADKIIFKNQKYKVIEKKDYSLNGFCEYHVILDYDCEPQ